MWFTTKKGYKRCHNQFLWVTSVLLGASTLSPLPSPPPTPRKRIKSHDLGSSFLKKIDGQISNLLNNSFFALEVDLSCIGITGWGVKMFIYWCPSFRFVLSNYGSSLQWTLLLYLSHMVNYGGV